MLGSDEQIKRAEIIIMLLAKLYVVLELSTAGCPLCQKSLDHDLECPIQLAWSLLDEDQQQEARTTIRALALTIGVDDSFVEPMTH